jgi:hypothetical protein
MPVLWKYKGIKYGLIEFEEKFTRSYKIVWVQPNIHQHKERGLLGWTKFKS